MQLSVHTGIHTMHARCRVQSSKYNYIIIHIQTHSPLCIQHMQKPLPCGNLQCSLWGVRCAHALWVVLDSEWSVHVVSEGVRSGSAC